MKLSKTKRSLELLPAPIELRVQINHQKLDHQVEVTTQGSNLIVKTSAKKTLKSSHKKNWEKKRKTLLQTKRLKHDRVNLSKKTLKSSHINAARD